MLASVTQNPAQRGEGCVHEFQPLHVQLKKILNEGRSAKLIEGLSSSRRAGDRSILDQLLRHTMPS